MTPLNSFEDVSRMAKDIGLIVNLFDDAEVNLETAAPSDLEVIPKRDVPGRIQAIIQEYAAIEFVVIARTEAPPLAEFDLPPDIDQQVGRLNEFRFARLDGETRLLNLIEIVLSQGWSVVSDIYFFPVEGGFLGYVSHHDEVLIYVLGQ